MGKATAATSEAVAAAAEKRRFSGKGSTLHEALQALPADEQGNRMFPTKDWLPNWNRALDMSDGWSSVMLGNWERQGHLTVLREGRRIVGVRLAAHQPTAVEPAPAQPEQATTESMKERVLALLQRRADSKGSIRETSEALRRELGLDVHDFTKYLWDLKKQGLLQFREKKIGTQKEIHTLQLRGAAVPRTVSRVERATLGDTVLASEPWEICPECYWQRRWHRVAPDDANLLICPSRPKEGSPAWLRKTGRGQAEAQAAAPRARRGDEADHVVKPRNVLGKTAPMPGRDRGYTKPGPVRSTWRCGECEPPKDFSDQVSLSMHKRDAHKPAEAQPEPVQPQVAQAVTAPASEEPVVDRLVEVAPGISKRVDPADYPEIRAMLAQQAARTRAVTALEAAGEDDMALALMAKMEEGMDPVVVEALRLARALGWDKEEARGNE